MVRKEKKEAESPSEEDRASEQEEQVSTPGPEQATEIHHHHYPRGRFNFGKFFLGVIIVFVGLVYLADSTGFIDVQFVFSLSQLWPLLVILIGLSLLSPRGWVSGMVGLVVVLVVLGVVAFLILGLGGQGTRDVNEIEIAVSLEEDVERAQINVRTGAGNLQISGEGEMLVEGKFESNFQTLETTSEVVNGTQEVTFRTEGSFQGILGGKLNEFDLSLNPTIPVVLDIDTGAVRMDLDLREVVIEKIDIDTGASSLNLALGDKIDNSLVDIDAGASSINITLPRSVGARLRLNAGLTSKNLVDFIQIDEHMYESANFDDAEKTVEIDLDLGVSSLNISWR